jgi:hypothetical protein
MGVGSYTGDTERRLCWLCQCLTWDGVGCFCGCCGMHCCVTPRTFVPSCVECLCYRCNCQCAREETGCIGFGCLGWGFGCFGCVICPHDKLLISESRVQVKIDNKPIANNSMAQMVDKA